MRGANSSVCVILHFGLPCARLGAFYINYRLVVWYKFRFDFHFVCHFHYTYSLRLRFFWGRHFIFVAHVIFSRDLPVCGAFRLRYFHFDSCFPLHA